jgi:hypothetical protein
VSSSASATRTTSRARKSDRKVARDKSTSEGHPCPADRRRKLDVPAEPCDEGTSEPRPADPALRAWRATSRLSPFSAPFVFLPEDVAGGEFLARVTRGGLWTVPACGRAQERLAHRPWTTAQRAGGCPHCPQPLLLTRFFGTEDRIRRSLITHVLGQNRHPCASLYTAFTPPSPLRAVTFSAGGGRLRSPRIPRRCQPRARWCRL